MSFGADKTLHPWDTKSTLNLVKDPASMYKHSHKAMPCYMCGWQQRWQAVLRVSDGDTISRTATKLKPMQVDHWTNIIIHIETVTVLQVRTPPEALVIRKIRWLPGFTPVMTWVALRIAGKSVFSTSSSTVWSSEPETSVKTLRGTPSFLLYRSCHCTTQQVGAT